MNKLLLEQATEALQRHWGPFRPSAAVVLGSGAAPLAEGLPTRAYIPYRAIPGLGQPSVSGHSGHLLLATWAETEVLVFQGRRHRYEGVPWESVILPIFLAWKMGARILILTNAAGALHHDFRPGDWMVIDDHINLMADNPLMGPHETDDWPRFPSQHNVYCAHLRHRFQTAARELGLPLRQGVYVAVPGPFYETPAEARALRLLGADAVGMSTAPEASFASALGLRTLALSCITNPAGGGGRALTHDEVQRIVAEAVVRLKPVMEHFFRSIRSEPV